MKDITANRHRGADTSVAAHAKVPENAREIQRERILKFISSQGDEGATCEETEMALGLPHQTCSARITELRKGGRIFNKPDTKRVTSSGCLARVHFAGTEQAP
jgi:hypothetical protein